MYMGARDWLGNLGPTTRHEGGTEGGVGWFCGRGVIVVAEKAEMAEDWGLGSRRIGVGEKAEKVEN